jgi:hypothetical protein
MLTHLLDGMSHATCSHGFTWCSMKSIGSVSLCHKITLCLLHRAFIRVTMVPSLMVRPVSSMIGQVPLQAASSLITDSPKNGPYTSFPYQTIQGRNIPLERTEIQIWANTPPKQQKWFSGILATSVYQSPFNVSCSSVTHRSFLHACTPARLNAVRVH